MDRYEKRVLRLREHVLSHEVKKEEALRLVNLEDEDINKETVDEEFEDINDLTKDKIIAKLEEKGIDHNPKDKKEVLYNLLVGE